MIAPGAAGRGPRQGPARGSLWSRWQWQQIYKVWQRHRKQRDRSAELAAEFEWLYSLVIWERAANVWEACQLNGTPIEVYCELEGPHTAAS